MQDRWPQPGQNNLWFHFEPGDTALVFVHGVLSDSRSCWTHLDPRAENREEYWPKLVTTDPRFAGVSIYLGGYYTAIDAGPYEVRNCADELFQAMGLPDVEGREPVLQRNRLVFVCHSTGGIVVRYMLDRRMDDFASKDVGLVLIASPSYGSVWSNRLELLTQFYRNALGQQLQWGSWSLKDLDARFKDLVHQRRIPGLKGVEAYENHFIVHRRFLPPRRLVVTEQSAGRYFGAPVLLRQTDHFSAVKPQGLDHPAHELLVSFFLREFKGTPASNRRSAALVVPPGPRPGPSKGAPRLLQNSLPNEYELLGIIHEGHHSAVAKCRLRRNGEVCVVKQTEARLVSVEALHALQRLRSSNIVTPRQIWSAGDQVYEELPFVDGVLLSDAVAPEAGGLTGPVLASCHGQLMGTLGELHQAGLIYRDVHPDNLLLVQVPAERSLGTAGRTAWQHVDYFGRGRNEVSGTFGIAWVLMDSTFVTTVEEASRRPAVIHGAATPEEQAVGQPTPASDMYALGATLYFGITGREVPTFELRKAGPDPLVDFPQGDHPSVAFAGHLANLLALDPKRRVNIPSRLHRNTISNEYTGMLQIAPDAFILIYSWGSDTRIVNLREALDFQRRSDSAESRIWISRMENSLKSTDESRDA